MKKLSITLISAALMITACQPKLDNPFFTEWDTPYGVPPFDKIVFEHYEPAFEEGMRQELDDIETIVNNTETPTFENTIVALDASGQLLNRVSTVFGNLMGSERTEQMQALQEKMAPTLSKHSDGIAMNPELFKRVEAVYLQKEQLGLQGEDAMLLEKIYTNFVRGGAKLNAQDQETLKGINEELSVLSAQYSKNALNANNAFRLIIENKDELSGLPEAAISAAAQRAKDEDHEGKWIFTLDKPSLIPFLTYADHRAHRETMFNGYANKGNLNDDNDNKTTAAKIASLYFRKAQLMGYPSAAAYILDDRMAKTPQAVNTFLKSLWEPTKTVLSKEAQNLQAKIKSEGHSFELQPWDWWYYTEKIKQDQYQFDEKAFSEYLKLENVVQGCFDVTTKLYGLTFEPLNDLPKFNPEAKAYLVRDSDGSELAIFYADYHPRASKRQGAWMTSYRKQSGYPEKNVLPIIINICNFTRASESAPALLSMDEASTLFHEFGHALHGMLSKCKYQTLSGTAVKRDFVELPSQIMENWAFHPQVLKMYAKHWKTGEIIPDSLVAKMEQASKFNMGFVTAEFLAAALLDMAWFELNTDQVQNTAEFEKALVERIGLIDAVIPRYRSTYFTHIFGGGYSAGYYSYIWAEVLDSDAFDAFVESGDIFDPQTAHAFRKEILEKGGSDDPMAMYVRFRGKQPNPEALLKKRGLQ